MPVNEVCGPKQILIVESDQDVAKTLQANLRSRGLIAFCVFDWQTASAFINLHIPDYIVGRAGVSDVNSIISILKSRWTAYRFISVGIYIGPTSGSKEEQDSVVDFGNIFVDPTRAAEMIEKFSKFSVTQIEKL